MKPIKHHLSNHLSNHLDDKFKRKSGSTPEPVIESARLPDSFKDLKTFDTSVHEKAERAAAYARRFVSLRSALLPNEHLAIVFSGDAGVGKTHLLRAIQWSSRLVADGTPIAPDGRMIDAFDFVRMQPEELTAIIRQQSRDSRIWVLCIDDIGHEGNFEGIRADEQRNERHIRYRRLFNLLYQNHIPIALSTNVQVKHHGLRNAIGKYAYDRLIEMIPAAEFLVDMWGVGTYRQNKHKRVQNQNNDSGE